MADAERRAQRRRAQAEREAGGILREARRQAEERRQRALGRAQVRAQREETRLRARTEQDVEAVRREAAQRILEQVQERARGELRRLADGPEHRGILVALALQGIEGMDGEEFELVLRPADREKWGQRLLWEVPAEAKRELDREVRVELAADEARGSGGLLVRSAGGRQVADQTFEARMERLWEQMRYELARTLPILGEASQ